jgi:hypothetical protein
VLIWRGWGFLTVVILFSALLFAQLATDAIGGGGTYESNPYIFGGIALVIGGIATHLVARWLDGRSRPRNLVDEATGERVVLVARNDFFWISMRTWGLVAVVAGVTMLGIGLYDRMLG